jgi:hypothetical protein
MRDQFMNDSPPGAKGIAAKTGYMNSDIFSDDYLPFFIEKTRCSKERPVLLILDNHCSHVSLKAVTLCKDSGIIMLTLPPHTSHKLQPLDRSVFGPLKTSLGIAAKEWMRNHPGRAISIYEIAQISATAVERAMSPGNIKSGFRCSGIYPFNTQIFQDHEFEPSMVTDQPDPQAADTLAVADTGTNNMQVTAENFPSTSESTQVCEPSTSVAVTPESILPLPKAKPRSRTTGRMKRKVKAAILTDTPEKRRLEEEQKGHPKNAKKKKGKAKAVKPDRRRAVPDSSDSEEDDTVVPLDTDSESGEDESQPDDITEEQLINVNDFVLVRYKMERRREQFYAAIVEAVDEENGSIHCNFLRKKSSDGWSFVYPTVADKDTVKKDDIVLKLGKPRSTMSSARALETISFEVDISKYNIL